MDTNLHVGEVDPDARGYHNLHVELLNDGQKIIFQTLREKIDNSEGGLFHIDAPGGTGKTFLCNVILAYVRQHHDVAIATAMSGIAATLLRLGTTAHKRFGFPIPNSKESSSSIKLNSDKAGIISQALVLFIDEVSMMHYYDLDCLDRFLRELMVNDSVMGGKLVVLMGDFRQILPVIPHGSRADIVSATVKNSSLWRNIQVLKLTQNMRVAKIAAIDSSPERTEKLEQYSRWLLDLGEGKTNIVCDRNIIKLPGHMICNTPRIVRQSVYNDFMENYQSTEYLSKRAIMASTNKVVQDGNCKMVDSLPGDLIVSKSIDRCTEAEDEATYDTDFLNMLNPSGLPPHRLVLKKNAVIILIRNLNIAGGHCNGTRYIVEDMSSHLIKAKKLNGGPNDIILIPKIPLLSKESDFPAIFKRLQFPVIGAYYLTFNRAQGQSLDCCGMELPSSVFTHGQLYVGASRTGDYDQVFVYADQKEFDSIKLAQQRDHEINEEGTFTRNVVYTEAIE